jgi:hypothetical protein
MTLQKTLTGFEPGPLVENFSLFTNDPTPLGLKFERHAGGL